MTNTAGITKDNIFVYPHHYEKDGSILATVSIFDNHILITLEKLSNDVETLIIKSLHIVEEYDINANRN